MALPLIWGQNKTKKAPHTLFETFIQKSQIQSSEGFLGGFFELKILKIFTTALLLKIQILQFLFQVLKSALLKHRKKFYIIKTQAT